MHSLVLRFTGLASFCGLIIACGVYPGEQRAAWRDEAENACVRSGYVQPSEKIVAVDPIGSYGCGMSHPYKVSEFPQSHVALSKPTTMACQMIPALDRWVKDVVQPSAMQHFGTYVTEIETAGSYSCRRINGSYSMSEHAYGNAMDVSGFKLADGRRVKVGQGFIEPPLPFRMSAQDLPIRSRQAYVPPVSIDEDSIHEEWEEKVLEALEKTDRNPSASYRTASNNFTPPPSDNQDIAFLDEVRSGACSTFATVLGPGQADHEDHLHVDLAHRQSGRHVCK
jgi:hypothetical protein